MKPTTFAAALILGFGICFPTFSETERIEKGSLILEGVPEIPEEVTDRLMQYQNTRSASVLDWDTRGEGLFVSTRFAETAQVHRVDRPGGMRRQMTFFPEPVRDASICPDPQQYGFLFAMDEGGGEFYQFYWFDLENNNWRRLTDGKSRNGGAVWSTRGDRFAYYSTRRNGKDWDLYVQSIDPEAEAVRVLEVTGTWAVEDWSRDDQTLLVGRYVSANESYLYTLDLESSRLTPVEPPDQVVAYGSARLAADGKGVFLTSDENDEFKRLRFYDLATKTRTALTDSIPWDVEEVELSEDGGNLAFTTNEDGISRLYLMDTETRQFEKTPPSPEGQIYGVAFHPDNTKLAAVFNTAQTPGDTFVLDFETQAWARWTESEVGGLDTSRFVSPRLVHYPTFDEIDGKKREIPAFAYVPPGPGPHPVLVMIHGGPESQFVPYFSPIVQYLVGEMGIAVVAPNVRGSSGYGKTFLTLDNGMKREESVRDIGGLLDWIAQQPNLDAERVAVMGGSYGGYMTYACLTHYGDRFKAGVANVAISHFITFLENTEDYRRELRRVEYGDERDARMRSFLEEISPLTNVAKIPVPMLISHGANDPRVPVEESAQMVEALRGKGLDAWYIVARDEGHGFAKKTNSDFHTSAVVLFLQKHLLGVH